MPALTDLLRPFLAKPLSTDQTRQVVTYLDLLLKWNAKISLTAVRAPEEMVQRHFGESLFAGEQAGVAEASSVTDVGSGAGFPGVPMAILAPRAQVTLIESQQRKVAFLREVVRALELKNVSVYAGRAENFKHESQIVTLRAVEKFEAVLQVAASLVESGGKLALLIGASQADTARKTLPNFLWLNPILVPKSRERIVLMGSQTSLAGQ
ncbi:MAG TPA: 16S rRNA (guanine(527)-N(7))-methyltransferase RsmG [Terriglobales bacterium]|jgi:16S rRNA (guanine527-N7)-methyltransferase|nr:16S rRNA (guanine(527)-N(7))-methyltransferase RsmG [Terriglobales bacterium]